MTDITLDKANAMQKVHKAYTPQHDNCDVRCVLPLVIYYITLVLSLEQKWYLINPDNP